MAKIKYYYDTESCKYERVKVSTWDIVLNALAFAAFAVVLGVGMTWTYLTYFESPEEASLKKENEDLTFYYDVMKSELVDMNKMLSNLQDKDDNIYRTIFEAEPIPSTIRNAGAGGVDRYKDIRDDNVARAGLIIDTYTRIDQLKKKMYIQTKSYDEIMDLALRKESLYASMPAIQPVSNKELKRLSSGYGYRIHPIYKTKRMHEGIDFAAPKGSPVYTTGDGVVERVKTSLRGYGKEVIVNHGFGYKTRYAHLNDFNVKQGQKVKRGECIGYLGNTGASTAPHLHYEVIKNNKKVDPVHYFYKDLNPTEYEEILRLASIENQSLGGE